MKAKSGRIFDGYGVKRTIEGRYCGLLHWDELLFVPQIH